jgi:hypothetical protein
MATIAAIRPMLRIVNAMLFQPLTTHKKHSPMRCRQTLPVEMRLIAVKVAVAAICLP